MVDDGSRARRGMAGVDWCQPVVVQKKSVTADIVQGGQIAVWKRVL